MTVALVLLPGLDGTGELFQPLLEQLPEAIEPIAVRYPSNEPLGYHALCDLVLQKIPSGCPFVLLGESFSGPVAILVASRRPAGLLGLILCASYVSAARRWPALFARFAPVHFGARLFGPQALMGRLKSRELRIQMQDALSQVPACVLRARLRAAARVDVTAELAALDIPTLYLRPSEDTVVPYSAAELYARTAGRGKVEVIAGPHFLLQCVPSAAARSIEQFVRLSEGAA